MKANGKVHKYGDNVDTDVIIPARYLNTPDAKELASHCMEDIDREFVNKVNEGDIMVGGFNFGCGSSREHEYHALSPRHLQEYFIVTLSTSDFRFLSVKLPAMRLKMVTRLRLTLTQVS